MEYIHLATSVATSSVAGVTYLQRVNVNTATASSVVTIYSGTTSLGDLVATVNCATLGSYDYGRIRLPAGLFAKMTGANSDVTISYE